MSACTGNTRTPSGESGGGGYYALESRIHSVAAVTALGSDDDTDDDVDDALSLSSLPSSAGCTHKVHIDSLRIE